MVNYDNTYWNDSGKYQSYYDKIKYFVPAIGESDNPDIELLRCMSNIYYDVYNNGGINFDVWHEQIKYLNQFMVSQGVHIDWLGLDYKFDQYKVWEEVIDSWYDEENGWWEEEAEEYDDNNYFDFTQKTCDELEIIADMVILHVYNRIHGLV